MPVETFTYLDSLNASNPVPNEGIRDGDDHIRGLKSVLKATFPGLNASASRQIDGTFGLILPNGKAAAPAYAFAAEPSLGFYRSGGGLILIAGGRLDGNGAVPVGSLHQFLYEPSKLGKGGVVPSGGAEYLELDGSTYNTADFSRLAQHMGATGSTFTLINATDTGRFLRSRTATLTAGTKQSNALKTHSVTASGVTDTQGHHAHNVSGSTSGMNRNNPHGHSYTTETGFPGGWARSAADFWSQTSGSTGLTDINHEHAVFGSTDGQGSHVHNVTVSGTVTGDAETRPEAIAAIFCIKT